MKGAVVRNRSGDPSPRIERKIIVAFRGAKGDDVCDVIPAIQKCSYVLARIRFQTFLLLKLSSFPS